MLCGTLKQMKILYTVPGRGRHFEGHGRDIQEVAFPVMIRKKPKSECRAETQLHVSTIFTSIVATFKGLSPDLTCVMRAIEAGPEPSPDSKDPADLIAFFRGVTMSHKERHLVDETRAASEHPVSCTFGLGFWQNLADRFFFQASIDMLLAIENLVDANATVYLRETGSMPAAMSTTVGNAAVDDCPNQILASIIACIGLRYRLTKSSLRQVGKAFDTASLRSIKWVGWSSGLRFSCRMAIIPIFLSFRRRSLTWGYIKFLPHLAALEEYCQGNGLGRGQAEKLPDEDPRKFPWMFAEELASRKVMINMRHMTRDWFTSVRRILEDLFVGGRRKSGKWRRFLLIRRLLQVWGHWPFNPNGLRPQAVMGTVAAWRTWQDLQKGKLKSRFCFRSIRNSGQDSLYLSAGGGRTRVHIHLSTTFAPTFVRSRYKNASITCFSA